MRGKLWFAMGAAAGFVLGARAGREKYEELVLNARKVWDHPTVQEAAGVVQAQANRLYTEGKDKASDKLGNTKIGGKLSSSPTTGTSTTGTGTSSTSDDTLATTGVTTGTTSTTGGTTSTGTSSTARNSSSSSSTGTTY